MDFFKQLGLALCLVVLSSPAWSIFGSSCKQAEGGVRPAWVQAGYSYARPGYQYGFAEAQYRKKENYQQQLARAESDARSALASSLQVLVESRVEIQSTVDGGGSAASVQQSMSQRTRTRTRLELPGLDLAAKWQDADSCTLYVLVEIADDIANLVSKKAVAETFYQQAGQQNQPVALRLSQIDNAIELARRWEFSGLANSSSSAELINKYSVIKGDLQRLLRSRQNVILFVAGGDEIAGPLSQKVSAQVEGSFKGGDCSTSTLCLHKAQQTPASYATIIRVRMDTIKERGFYVGSFELQLSVWDLSSNRQLYSTAEDATLRSAKVMARQQHKVTPAAGYQKWLRANPGALDKLSQHYSKSR